jgi:hypothetical protein
MKNLLLYKYKKMKALNEYIIAMIESDIIFERLKLKINDKITILETELISILQIEWTYALQRINSIKKLLKKYNLKGSIKNE